MSAPLRPLSVVLAPPLAVSLLGYKAPRLITDGQTYAPCCCAQELMRKWAPGVGAGLFLERAISRKAADMTAAAVMGALDGGQGTIRAARPAGMVA